MSLADELLATLTEDIPTHEHIVTDDDGFFIINPNSREIENASRGRNVIMQYDHKSEIYTFELPRYIEGHDMTLCNRVRVHFNNVDGETNEENADVAEMYDLAVSPDDPDIVRSTWEITRQATQLAGTLNFLIQYECIDDSGESVYEWHTDIYSNVEVRAGRDNGEQAVIEYSNVLEQWYQRLFGAGDSVMADIVTLSEEQKTAIQAEGEAQKTAVALKGEETLKSIPEDYTTTYNMAEEALRTKANAIELEAEGNAIIIDDSSDAYLLGLNVYGKTTQATIPDPGHPQELKSVESPTIDIYGSNLLNYELWTEPVVRGGEAVYVDNGVILTAGDGGDAYTNYSTSHSRINCIPGVKYILSWEHTGDVGLAYIFPNAETTNMVSVNTSQSTYLEYIPPEGVNYFTFRVGVMAANATAVYKNIRINAVEQVEYEAYKEPQSMATSHSLLSVSTSDGDICDEIDFERGVLVQRLARYIFDGSDDEAWSLYDSYNGAYIVTDLARGSSQYATPMYCNYAKRLSWGDGSKDTHYCFINGYDDFVIGGSDVMAIYPDVAAWRAQLATTPCEVIYQLETPIEVPLTEEEITYYKRLKTHYHNTTILNSSGARMLVKYAADTEIYLRDNQPGPTDEQVEAAVSAYFDENGVQVPSDDHINSLIDAYLEEVANGSY